ncbi:MAG: lytic transglycosylase domain-containing protein [Gemmatimonas sp.]|jgi:soluble lytic murein transglycosylase-like protein|uniref:lytic transglycosylase domain-containing protein n=1 Tax=Gemmatimonas sp. TaxID=1962908 RepID=UPI00391F52D6|nr:transglycosylase SLT domain-containing protein [Gemmatimonadota bacterium]
MHDPVDIAVRHDAVARRRRMHRRHTQRRLSRVLVAGATVFGLALAVGPETPTLTEVVPPAADSIGPVALAGSGTLTAPSLWRPAGDVLKRGKATGRASLPLAPDAREQERKESLSRWHHIYTYSTRYRIKPDLARRIYDAAVTAGLEPELGFRLVRVESVFNPRAVSRAGALGLTQLMYGTAREFEPSVTREQLLDPDVNLRIGFKYLRTLIREYKGDLKLALLVYNRGPTAVNAAIAMGMSPANGYESIVTRGYRGRGTLD